MARGRTSSIRIVLSAEERHTLEHWPRSTTLAAGLVRQLAAVTAPASVWTSIEHALEGEWGKRGLTPFSGPHVKKGSDPFFSTTCCPVAGRDGVRDGSAEDGAPTGAVRGPAIAEAYQVIVECRDEDEQREVYERLTSEGFSCRLTIL